MRIIGSALLAARRMFFAIKFRNRIKFGQRVVFRKDFNLNPSMATARITIGDDCFFNNHCSINCHTCVSIGNRSTFGEGVKIYDHDHNYRKRSDGESNTPLFIDAPISIGDDCWLGSNVLVLKGVTIGNNVVIGAGVVVTKDIPDNTVVYAKQDLVHRPI